MDRVEVFFFLLFTLCLPYLPRKLPRLYRSRCCNPQKSWQNFFHFWICTNLEIFEFHINREADLYFWSAIISRKFIFCLSFALPPSIWCFDSDFYRIFFSRMGGWRKEELKIHSTLQHKSGLIGFNFHSLPMLSERVAEKHVCRSERLNHEYPTPKSNFWVSEKIFADFQAGIFEFIAGKKIVKKMLHEIFLSFFQTNLNFNLSYMI